MKLLTKQNDVSFTPDGIYSESLDQYFSGYMGATKLVSFGEEQFVERMERIHGKEEAKKIIKKSRKRGDSMHAKLETDYKSMLPDSILSVLGEQVDYEIFTHGKLFGLNTLGFVDALFRDDEGRYHIVDYKTKNKPYYNLDLTKYWMQLAIYSMLMSKQYGLDNIVLDVVIVYKSGDPAELHTLDKADIKSILRNVKAKCRAVLMSRSI